MEVLEYETKSFYSGVLVFVLVGCLVSCCCFPAPTSNPWLEIIVLKYNLIVKEDSEKKFSAIIVFVHILLPGFSKNKTKKSEKQVNNDNFKKHPPKNNEPCNDLLNANGNI